MDADQAVRRAFRETTIVCGAMVASVLIYAVVVEVLRARLPPGGVGAGLVGDVLRYAFYLLAGVARLAIPFARRAAEAGGGETRLRGSGRKPWWRPPSAEAPAVLGFALYLLAGRRQDFYVLAGWSLLLHLLHLPRSSAGRRRRGPQRTAGTERPGALALIPWAGVK